MITGGNPMKVTRSTILLMIISCITLSKHDFCLNNTFDAESPMAIAYYAACETDKINCILKHCMQKKLESRQDISPITLTTCKALIEASPINSTIADMLDYLMYKNPETLSEIETIVTLFEED